MVIMVEKLAILDAGAQYGKVIDRRVRELNVFSELLPMNSPVSSLKEYKAVIISGGPESVYDKNAPKHDPLIFGMNIPILGICYGMHLMSYAHEGVIRRKSVREDGQEVVRINNSSKLFHGLGLEEKVLLTHGDSVINPGKGFVVIANSPNRIIAAIENPAKRLYGVQFHPEVDLTVNGRKVLHNFLYNIAGFSGDYTLEDREAKAVGYIRGCVGDKEVLVLVSGGVDSSVCAALLNKALGPEKIHALHIDNGLMRLNESLKVKEALEKTGLKLRVVDASQDFYNSITTVKGNETKKLNEAVSPEEKRNIIGDAFMRVAERAVRELGLNPNNVYLAQGTLRPDLIESASTIASSKADVIKTHHNDTALVRELRKKGMVVEPLKDYHKDEVRVLGKSLGLPDELVWRQPFPGPGLGVRIICADKPYINDDFGMINQQLKDYYANDSISATLLPIQTVGVQGDGRSYSYLVGLSGEKDWDELFRMAKDIPKRIHKVNRIAYLFGEKITSPINNITITHITPDVIKQLQLADDIVNQALIKYGLLRKLSQVPIISFPLGFGIEGARSIAIRTFITNDFMTGVPAVPGSEEMPLEALDEMVGRILSEVNGISRVAYDLTSKPPGTTEWE